MTFDISDTLAPKSDQLDAVDLLGSPPCIFTVTEVSRGNAEQPVQIKLAEFPRVWRPSKGMRRVLANCWGKQSGVWVGRRVELYCDPDVMFGKEKVGGVRISRLSHIDGPVATPMIVGRGKGGSWKVDPLPELSRRDQLKAEWRAATPERRAEIEAEVKALGEGE